MTDLNKLKAEIKELPVTNMSDGPHINLYEVLALIATHAAEPAPVTIERRKFYRKDWSLTELLKARNGKFLTDKGEAWRYEFSHMDGEGGEYDMLYRRVVPLPSAEPAPVAVEEPAHLMLDRLGMDGKLWAEEFHATAQRLGYQPMDDGWLIGWFCNAVMAGYDEAQRRHRADLAPTGNTALVDALRPFAQMVDKNTCEITVIWQDGDYKSTYTGVLKPAHFYAAGDAYRAALASRDAAPQPTPEVEAWNGPGEKRHTYSPDYQAMGDCRICGHDWEAHQPAALARGSVDGKGEA